MKSWKQGIYMETEEKCTTARFNFRLNQGRLRHLHRPPMSQQQDLPTLMSRTSTARPTWCATCRATPPRPSCASHSQRPTSTGTSGARSLPPCTYIIDCKCQCRGKFYGLRDTCGMGIQNRSKNWTRLHCNLFTEWSRVFVGKISGQN